MLTSHRILLVSACLLLTLRMLPAQDAAPDATTVAAFRAACTAKAAAAKKNYAMTVGGKDGWMFFAPELRSAGAGPFWGEAAVKVSQASMPENADPLPAILDFKAQLDKAGIELLFVPVPLKAVVYADKVLSLPAATVPRLDTAHQEFYALLRQNGIDVLDLTPEFLAHRGDKDGPVYCKQDTHWSGRACVLAARSIAVHVKDRPWLAGLPRRKFGEAWKKIQISGDLWQGFLGQKPAKESLPLRFIGTKSGAALKPVEPERSSPIVLLGDSHDLVFHAGEDMHTKGAGLPDQLLFELGFPVDLIAVRGSGATPARTNLMRRARANPNYLKQKKLVIWCFSAREFTESLGWQKVPVVK